MGLNGDGGREKCSRLECIRVLPETRVYTLEEDPEPKRRFCSNACACLARDNLRYLRFLKRNRRIQ